MAIFVVDTLTYGQQAAKLVAQLEDHIKKDIKKPITNFSLETIIEQIKNFNNMLAKQVDDQLIIQRNAEGKVIDDLGNEWLGHYAYRYYEITYNNKKTIDRIRYLGPSPLGANRFIVERIVNPFTYITVTNLVADIREINKSPLELNIEQLFQCKRDAWKKDSEIISGKTLPPYRYSWDYLEKNYFSPRAKYDNRAGMTEAEINAIIKANEQKSVKDKEKLEQYLSTIQSNKKAIAEKAEKQIEKSETPLDWWVKNYVQSAQDFTGSLETAGKESGKIISQFIDKFSIGCIIEEAIKCVIPQNISCKRLFENLPAGQFMERLKTVFPEGNNTLRQIELVIEKEIFGTDFYNAKKELEDLKKWIQEDRVLLKDIEEELKKSPDDQNLILQKNNLEQKIEEKRTKIEEHERTIKQKTEEVAPDLKLSKRQQEQILNDGGNIAAIFTLPTEDEVIGPQALTVKILAAIDTIIPIEDVCEAITNAISFSSAPPFINFDGLPPFEFPKPRPIKDIFGGGLELNEAFARLLTESLISLIDGILADLISCDNLDNFIAQTINGGFDGQQFDDLATLFSKERVGEIVEENYDRFVDQIAGKVDSIFTAGTDNSTKIGLSQQAAEAILKNEPMEQGSFAGATMPPARLFEAAESQATWDIDITGTKFETIFGTKVFDTTEIDKFFSKLSREQRQLLQQNGKYTTRAISDSLGIDIKIKKEGKVTGEITLTPDERSSLKEEVNCIMQTITSVLMPSQVLDLLAGRASEKTKQTAYEAVQISCEFPIVDGLFQNKDSFSDMFKTFGMASGLDKLKGEVEVLADSPQIRNSITMSKCGPYENMDIFREELLSRTIDKESAKQIIENLNNERINRYNEISNKIMEMSKGIANTENVSDPSDVLLRSIKQAFESGGIQANPIKPQQGEREQKSVQNIIQEQIDRKIKDSPVVQDMFNIVLDSFFYPIEQVFNDDIKSLTDAMGDIVEVEEGIERLQEVTTPDGSKVQVVNPEFKRMVDVGLVPILNKKSDKNEKYAKMIDKKSLNVFNLKEALKELPVIGEPVSGLVPDLSFILDNAAGQIGYNPEIPFEYYVSGDSNVDFVKEGFNGAKLKPILKKINRKVIGSELERNLTSINVSSTLSDNEIVLNLSGKISSIENERAEQIGLAQNLPQEPTWNIRFKEYVNSLNKIVNSYDLNTNGIYMTSINGVEPFYVPYFSYTENVENKSDITQYLIKRYDNIQSRSRKFIFDDIIFENIQPLIDNRNNDNLKQEFSFTSLQKFERIIKNFITSISRGVSDSNLLKKQLVKGKLITKLETLNFTKDCEHILDFKEMREIDFPTIYDYFNNLPEKVPTLSQMTGLAKRESPLADTSKIILSKILIKTLCVDTALKALPALDFFSFSKSLIQNDMMKRLTVSYIIHELERLKIKDFVIESLDTYYKVQQFNEPDEPLITDAEKVIYNNKGLDYPLELEKFVIEQFYDVMNQIRKVLGNDLNQYDKEEDFLSLFLNDLELIDVHSNIGLREQERDSIIQDNEELSKGGFALQKYMFIPKINKDSSIIKENKDFFTNQKILELDNLGIVNFDTARDIISEIKSAVGQNFDLFICEGENGYENRFFEEPYQVGLRVVFIEEKEDNRPVYKIGENEYPYILSNCQYSKAGYINEANRKAYELQIVAYENYKVNQKDTADDFLKRDNQNRYMVEFYDSLKKRLLEDEEINLFFSYAIPLKEITTIILYHSKLSNNTKKMRYLFEPTKKSIQRMFDFLNNTGNDTLSSERIRQTMEKVEREKENVGNPAGPLDFSALKMFYRTPIHLLKGVAIATDPNIALTDKIISAISLVSSLSSAINDATSGTTGVDIPKIPIPPYSLVSLSLLPFPLFTPPPAGIIPPLTSYNIGSPIGPIFLALEPLLWDLPFYKSQNNETLFGGTPECKDNKE